MSRPRCISCGSDWGRNRSCRLSDEEDAEAWVQVYVCTSCWQAAARQHRARLAEVERRLLAEWDAPRGEQQA